MSLISPDSLLTTLDDLTGSKQFNHHFSVLSILQHVVQYFGFLKMLHRFYFLLSILQLIHSNVGVNFYLILRVNVSCFYLLLFRIVCLDHHHVCLIMFISCHSILIYLFLQTGFIVLLSSFSVKYLQPFTILYSRVSRLVQLVDL